MLFLGRKISTWETRMCTANKEQIILSVTPVDP